MRRGVNGRPPWEGEHNYFSHGGSAGRPILLSEGTVQRLEELRRRAGKESVAEVVEEATELYARLRCPEEIAVYERLTPRLREVLRMIGEGAATKEIAARLRVSPKTVEFHRAQLMRKLNIEGVAGLVRYAVRVGAVPP
jgi:DNA-binding NarL/FixJ family response regulator